MATDRHCLACGAPTSLMGNGGAYCNNKCAAEDAARTVTGAAEDAALALGPGRRRRAPRSHAPAGQRPEPPPTDGRARPCIDLKCPCRRCRPPHRNDPLPSLTHARLRRNSNALPMNLPERAFEALLSPQFRIRDWTLYPQVKLYNPCVRKGRHMIADFIAVFGRPCRRALKPADMALIELDGLSTHVPGADRARNSYALAAYGLAAWHGPSAPQLDGRRAPGYRDDFFAWAGGHAERAVEIERAARERVAAIKRARREAAARAAADRARDALNEANYSAYRVADILAARRNPLQRGPVRPLRREPLPDGPRRLDAPAPLRGPSLRHIPAWRKGIEIGPGFAERQAAAARAGGLHRSAPDR